MATLMAFKRDIAVGIIPNLYSGIMFFCDNFCFELSKKKYLDLSNNTNRIIIRIYVRLY